VLQAAADETYDEVLSSAAVPVDGSRDGSAAELDGLAVLVFQDFARRELAVALPAINVNVAGTV
jgi:hypothetical protein